ncbi:hypothetical protein AB5J62_12150 [Amycolatopsis sp. cg5]|uniref:hypothetical protein n=1 Tax=Amycolatopsis sp. cg5 TaxID=3238802 RepID=UPI003525D791
MGSRYWFPLALLGFAQIGMAALATVSAGWFDSSPYGYTDQASGHFGYSKVFMSSEAYEAQLNFSFDRDVTRLWPYLMAVVLVATVTWYAVKARRAGAPYPLPRTLGVAFGGVVAIAVVEFVSYAGFGLSAQLRDPVIVTAGLLVLVWLERSVLLGVVAGLFLLTALLLTPGQAGLLIPAAVVLAGAFVALAKRGIPGPAGT